MRPRITSTHTFAKLEISAAAYFEIKAKLREAGYQHAFIDGAIDMHGIGIVRDEASTSTKAEDLNAELSENHTLIVTKGDSRYMIMEDEDGNGFHAWLIPVGEEDHSVHSFSSESWSDESGIPDYQELSEEIAEWIAP